MARDKKHHQQKKGKKSSSIQNQQQQPQQQQDDEEPSGAPISTTSPSSSSSTSANIQQQQSASSSSSVRLERIVHVANAWCKCPPRSALQAQAQSQPSHLSFQVICATHAVHLETVAELLVLALSNNGLLLRLSGSAWGSSSGPTKGGGAGLGGGIDEGDYLYELPLAPMMIMPGREESMVVAQQGQIACMAVSPDLRRLLCVTRQGNAYGLQVNRVVKAASRVYNGEATSQVHWTSPSGPSLYEYSMDPKYHREGPGGSGPQPKDISLGTNSTEGDFQAKCCLWWIPARCKTSMAIVGGRSSGKAAISILDMDQEREVDLIYIPETSSGRTAAGQEGVASLSIHSSTGQAGGGGSHRLLIMTRDDGRLSSLVLETPNDPIHHSPPRGGRSRASSISALSPSHRDPHHARRTSYESSPSKSNTTSTTTTQDLSPARPLSPSLLTPQRQRQSDGNVMMSSKHGERGRGGAGGREAESLWDRCLWKREAHASILSPRQPKVSSCCSSSHGQQDVGQQCPLSPQSVDVSLQSNLIAVVPSTDNGGGSAAAGSEQLGLILGRLVKATSSSSPSTFLIEIHFCALQSGGVYASPKAKEGQQPCRQFCVIDLEKDMASLSSARRTTTTEVRQVVKASAMGDTILLSLLCRDECPAADASDKVGVIRNTARHTSYWLLVYTRHQHQESAVTPKLLRAFKSPTAAPLQFLGWLNPIAPSARDVLDLAREDLFLASNASTSTLPETAVFSLVVWSRCSVCLLRILGRQSSSQRQQQSSSSSITLLGYPTSLKVRPSMPEVLLAPGSVLQFIESLVNHYDQIDGAIAFGWALLLRSSPPKGPVLHARYLKLLTGADPTLDEASGSANLAAKMVGWMIQAKATWVKEDLLKFLEICQDYRLKEMVDVLLFGGRVSEALYCSWVREGSVGIEETLERLASSPTIKSLLSPSDVAWLCGIGAGEAIIRAGHSILWNSLPIYLQIEVLLSDSELLLLPKQYQWLLTILSTMPRQCLGSLVIQLVTWLELFKSEKAAFSAPAPLLPLTPRDMEGHEGGGGGLRQTFSFPDMEEERSLVSVLRSCLDSVKTYEARPIPDASLLDQEEGDDVDGVDGRHDTSQLEAKEQERVERLKKRRQLCELLLEALLIMARPLLGTITVVQAHALAKEGHYQELLSSSYSSSSEQAEALHAQFLLEMLVILWTRRDVSLSARGVPALSFNSPFIPSILFVKAKAGKNAGCAALLLEASSKWEGGLDMRLKELVEIAEERKKAAARKKESLSSGSDEGEEGLAILQQAVLGLFHSHVLYRERGGGSLDWTSRRSMTSKILRSWAALKFPSAPLQSFCQREECKDVWQWHLMNALCTDLLILHAGEEGAVADADGSIGDLRFPKEFYHHLSQHVMKHGKEMQLEGVTDIWSTGGRRSAVLQHPRSDTAMWEALFKQIQSLETEHAAESRIEVPVYRLVEAGTTTKRGSVGGPFDGSAGAYLRSPATKVVGLAPMMEGQVIVFNCGHVLNPKELLQRAVPNMEARLTSFARPLHLTTEMLCQEYRDLTQPMSVACPACVTDFLIEVSGKEQEGGGKEEKGRMGIVS